MNGGTLGTPAVDDGLTALLIGTLEPLAPVLIWCREGRGDDCHDLCLPQVQCGAAVIQGELRSSKEESKNCASSGVQLPFASLRLPHLPGM